MKHLSGRLGNMKRRKEKLSLDASKASSGRRMDKTSRRRPKMEKMEPRVCGHGRATCPLEHLSRISCECHQFSDRMRCVASPLPLEEQEDKENDEKLEPSVCRINCMLENGEGEHGDVRDAGEIIFPDDDSNQILPVEHFFGNLDSMQDVPQRVVAASIWGQRSQRRRRHYYAREDSDEEPDDDDDDDETQQSHPGDS